MTAIEVAAYDLKEAERVRNDKESSETKRYDAIQEREYRRAKPYFEYTEEDDAYH